MTRLQRLVILVALTMTAMLVMLPPWRYTLQSYEPSGGMTTEYVTEYAPLWRPPATGSRVLIGAADRSGARSMIERPHVDIVTVLLYLAALWSVAGAVLFAMGGARTRPFPNDAPPPSR